MKEAYPNLKYKPDHQVGLESLANKINDHYYNFFDTFVDEEGRYLSEDYAFCRLWQRIGGKVYADANSKLTHTGSYQYQGDFARMLKSRYTEQPAANAQPTTAPVSSPVLQITPNVAKVAVPNAPALLDITATVGKKGKKK
jgi:hypothetical protein